MYPLFQNNIQSHVFGYPIRFLPQLGAKLVNRNRYDLILANLSHGESSSQLKLK